MKSNLQNFDRKLGIANKREIMDKPRPCGCKGCRTCLICEKDYGISKNITIDKVRFSLLLKEICFYVIFCFRPMERTFIALGVIKHGQAGI